MTFYHHWYHKQNLTHTKPQIFVFQQRKLLQNGILFHKDNFRVEASAFQPQQRKQHATHDIKQMQCPCLKH